MPLSAWPAGLSTAQISLAKALAQTCPSASGSLAGRCQQLQALNPALQDQALISLTPFQFLPQTGMPMRLWPKQAYSPKGKKAASTLLSGGGYADALGGSGAGEEAINDGPWGLIFQNKYQGSSKSLPYGGFNANSYELTLGADYRLNEFHSLGAAFTYSYSEAVMNAHTGNMRSNIYRALLFGSHALPADIYFNWLGIYTHYDNSILRQFTYPGFAGQASSTPQTDIYSATATLGQDFQFQAWSANPYLRLEYSYLTIGAYQESSLSGLAYQVGHQADDSLVLIPGLQLQRVFSTTWGVLTPSLRFEYEHQFLNDNRLLHLRLADAAAGQGYFVLPTGSPDRDYFNLGGSLSFVMPGGVSAFLLYEHRLGQAHLNSRIVEMGVRVPFD